MSVSSSAEGGAVGAGAFSGISAPCAGQCPQDHSLNRKEKHLSWEAWCQQHVFTKKTDGLERHRCKTPKLLIGALG